MFLKTKYFIGGLPVAIVAREETRHHLSGTCFRTHVNNWVAGNFFLFKSCRQLFEYFDYKWLEDFIKDAEEVYHQGEDKTASFSFDFGCNVGWSGTDNLFDYNDDEIEEFDLNRRSCGLRVKIGRRDLLAPLTSIVTVVYEIRPEKDQIVVVIRSIYPGKDIGELDGNISQREAVVFFDLDHPGEPPMI